MQAPYSSPNSVPNTPLNSPAPSSSAHAPMPLRARSISEQLDLAVKVYRRYFGVLTAWSALVMGACTIVGLLGFVWAGPTLMRAAAVPTFSPGYSPTSMIAPMLGMFALFSAAGLIGFFGYPTIIGAVACSVTAAVRGQKIEFEQCWQFSRPRYGGMLLQLFLAILLSIVMGFAVAMVFGIVIAVGVAIGAAIGQASSGIGWLLVAVGIVALIALYILLIVLGLAYSAWITMVPLVSCMEDNRRSSGAIGRAWGLMRGGWWRAAGLMFLVSAGLGIITLILQAIASIFTGGLSGSQSTTAEAAVSFLSTMLAYTVSLPFSALVVALFYLDQRVRHEALDLEWASYSGTETIAKGAAAAPIQDDSRFAPNAYAPSNYAPSNGAPQSNAQPSYAPTPYSSANASDTDVFNASTEDLASMPLDAFAPQRSAATTDFARMRAETQAQAQAQSQVQSEANAMQIPQAPPVSNAANSDHATQVLSPFSSDEANNDATSSTQSSTRSADDSATKTCASCGARAASTQNFCLSCGARF